MNSDFYHLNYSSLSRRGTENSGYSYLLTVHKKPVLRSGFEIAELLERVYNRYENIWTYGSESNEVERFEKSLQRSRNAVVQYVANNDWDYFVTLTLSADKIKEYGLTRSDLKGVAKVVCQFFVNYSRRRGAATGFKYLLIPEYHKDGAVHFHGVLMGINPDDLFVNENCYFDFKPYRDRFGWVCFSREKANKKGDFCTMGRIRNLEACAKYISKYITKDMFLNEKIDKGGHLYYCSKGLKKDKRIAVGTPVYSADEFLKMGLVSFENEYCSKVVLDDEEAALSLIVPFSSDGKKINFNKRYSVKTSLKEKREIRKRLVYRHIYDPRIEFSAEVSENNLDDLWKYCIDNFCFDYDEYSILKECGTKFPIPDFTFDIETCNASETPFSDDTLEVESPKHRLFEKKKNLFKNRGYIPRLLAGIKTKPYKFFSYKGEQLTFLDDGGGLKDVIDG